ncbi:uncharacterized protein LOC143237324 [Tachypleus tridentatus]|uniref:uncharacterized protein LOC143237324 n=1 Tax=Tachypleus tridentatus TaxID=6853 RepID=UPI003FD6A488
MDPGFGFFFRLPSEVEHSGGNVNGIMGPGRDTLINNLSSSVNLNFERSKMSVSSSGESPNKSSSDSVIPVSISSSESLAHAKKQVENTAILHPCHLCGKSFAKKDFHFHMPCHYTEILSCNMCSEKFTVKKTLLDHCRTLHAITDPIICELCGKCFSSVDSFQNHQTIHSGDKPYPCEVCFQSFSEKSLLMHHLRTHYSEKPYRCHYCGKGFTLKGNLKIHVQGHEGIKPFVCEICGKKVYSKIRTELPHELAHREETIPL